MFDQPIIMLDFETTGLSPAMGERITEVAALRIHEGRIVDRYVSLVNCGMRIPGFITQLTGISQRMVDNAPPVADVVPRLIDFIGTDALSAHNASFDAKFLQAESAQLGLVPQHSQLICSLKLARRVFPNLDSYKLGALARSLGLRFNGNAHRAEADAEVSAQLLIHIGAHLRHSYRIETIEAPLLASVNKLAAAKVADFLQKQGLPGR